MSRKRAGEPSIGFVASGDLSDAAEMEHLPIDSLWTGGHVASRNASPEALMSLARLSAVTSRVRLGTSILLLPLYPPAIVAKQIADLDRATSGRLVLGVGVGGEYPQEFRACGVPVAERGPRTDEAIPLIRRLWTGQPVSHDGPFFPMQDVRIHPAPAQSGGPPIVVAGRKPPAMRRAALLGDGWMPYLYSPRRYAQSVQAIETVAARAERDLSGFEWYAWVFVNVDPDPDRAKRQAAATMGGAYDQDFRPMVDRVAAAGDIAQVTDRLKEFVDAGAHHFIFMPASGGDDPKPVIDRLLDQVWPAVRTHATGVV